MLSSTRTVNTFPSVTLPSYCGGLPVEVSLITQLGVGSGDQVIAGVSARQREHAAFVDELDEPSARIGGIDLARGDATSLYTFTVGAQGHPFHRHAGHRVFTAISGSAGTQLRFSTASSGQIAEDPLHFVRALRHVNIPPDCLFTVRFGGGTWHQFVPLRGRSSHPALFALSCHTNELGGDLSEALRQRVAGNEADIPALTEVLPQPLLELLRGRSFDPDAVPTTSLALHASVASPLGRLCAWIRDGIGRMRGAWGRWRVGRGFLTSSGMKWRVKELKALPADSLLRTQLPDDFDHEDLFELTAKPGEHAFASAPEAVVALLQGFLENRPQGVSQLMAFRNVLVKPLGLRTSPLGCPVSSLLAKDVELVFAGRFPVLGQECDATGRRVQVILGADDKHLRFRSCVGVQLCPDGSAVFSLGTRVRTRNWFGRLYLTAIDRVHRRYVTPAMLRMAVSHALERGVGGECGTDKVANSAQFAYSSPRFAHG